jgi:hypothetical protein
MISDAMSGKSKIEVVIRPDLTFTAAHSNIWGALGLDDFGSKDAVPQDGEDVDAHNSDGRGHGSDREGGNHNEEGDNDSNLSFNRRGMAASVGGLSGKEEAAGESPSGTQSPHGAQ